MGCNNLKGVRGPKGEHRGGRGLGGVFRGGMLMKVRLKITMVVV